MEEEKGKRKFAREKWWINSRKSIVTQYKRRNAKPGKYVSEFVQRKLHIDTGLRSYNMSQENIIAIYKFITLHQVLSFERQRWNSECLNEEPGNVWNNLPYEEE